MITPHLCRLFQTSGILLHELQIIRAQLTDQELKEEVSLLIEAIAASPNVINLRGFITVNRELLTTESNPDLPVLSRQVYCESDVLDPPKWATTELIEWMFSILVSHLVILLQFHYSFSDATKTNPPNYSLSTNSYNFSSEDYSTTTDYTRD
ncbi:unnamed protein product [Timema podura]|uniref:Uncharacterized protein n=1 Tax=Timema podura TaxID=61482 RepID=A0ABN7P0H6_TIMPD|nr:unnamed protein product [Timema podura]